MVQLITPLISILGVHYIHEDLGSHLASQSERKNVKMEEFEALVFAN
jgi:hypothetical protein